MPAVRRPDPRALVLDLTRRLAEEFDTVPIPNVRSAVESAVTASRLFGGTIVDSLDTIERLAREDLAAVHAVTLEQADAALAS